MIFSWLGYLGGLAAGGWLVSGDNDDLFPWYVNAILSFVFIVGGMTLSLVVLTKYGVLDAITKFFATYFSFILDVLKAVAKPIIDLVT